MSIRPQRHTTTLETLPTPPSYRRRSVSTAAVWLVLLAASKTLCGFLRPLLPRKFQLRLQWLCDLLGVLRCEQRGSVPGQEVIGSMGYFTYL